MAGSWLLGGICFAHDPGLSYGEFILGPGGLSGRIIFNSVDLDILRGNTAIPDTEFESILSRRAVEAIAL